MKASTVALSDQAQAAHSDVTRCLSADPDLEHKQGKPHELVTRAVESILRAECKQCPHLKYDAPEPAWWLAATEQLYCRWCAEEKLEAMEGTLADCSCDGCHVPCDELVRYRDVTEPIVAPETDLVLPPLVVVYQLCDDCNG